jgi:hypothetical protein
MSDDEIQTFGGGPLEDVHGSHHGDGDAGAGRVGIAGFESVDSVCLPERADVLLDGGDNLTRLGDGSQNRGGQNH